MKTKVILFTVALGAVMGLSARVGGMPNMASFTNFDLNKNGVITKQEFLKVRANRQAARAKAGYPMRNVANSPSFESIDANGDGVITSQEFLKFRQNRMGRKGRGR